LRSLGKCVPARIAARVFAPGKKFRIRQKLPSVMGKYFHFSKKAAGKNPAILRKILVHGETDQGKRQLQRLVLARAKKAEGRCLRIASA